MAFPEKCRSAWRRSEPDGPAREKHGDGNPGATVESWEKNVPFFSVSIGIAEEMEEPVPGPRGGGEDSRLRPRTGEHGDVRGPDLRMRNEGGPGGGGTPAHKAGVPFRNDGLARIRGAAATIP
ncbi:hypothetical protein AAFF_G00167140 [Aldrovandia affinis]|uniref:Uncharacterized protein n=1 Tax=Aldrovandia affinis TaxID=143900 RepID=A0AAD7RMH8_9TELE|nr:hypothetical protein AAFF_G00167140 [Aldrovandia affinis]